MSDAARFLKQFLSRPKQVGSLWPSSSHLAHSMTDWIDWSTVHHVMELGPGTGPFTQQLVTCAANDATIMAIEINPTMAKALQQRFPQVTVCEESVANARSICQRHNIAQIDAIICGLPWANFSPQEQETFMGAITDVLRPGGYFATFAYLQGMLLPAAQRFRRTLKRWFPTVELSPTVWRNIPPAFVYRCRR